MCICIWVSGEGYIHNLNSDALPVSQLDPAPRSSVSHAMRHAVCRTWTEPI